MGKSGHTERKQNDQRHNNQRHDYRKEEIIPHGLIKGAYKQLLRHHNGQEKILVVQPLGKIEVLCAVKVQMSDFPLGIVSVNAVRKGRALVFLLVGKYHGSLLIRQIHH